LTAFMVPKMTLQPLVENAIYHGLRTKGQPGWIRIEAKVEAGYVIIEVSDDGVGLDPAALEAMNQTMQDQQIHAPGKAGYGLTNVHQRLRLTYGPEAGLHFTRNEAGGLTVTVRIPREGGVNARVLDTDR